MATTFYLLRKNAIRSSIMITVSYQNVVYKSATGLSCNPANWSNTNYRVNKKEKNHIHINHCLGEYAHRINSSLIELQIQRMKIEQSILKSIFNSVKNDIFNKNQSDLNGEESDIATFIAHFEEFIKVRGDDPNYSTGIVKNYKKCLNHILKYQEVKKVVLDYNTIDKEFYINFLNYLSVELNLQRNTVGNIIKTLKTFLNWSFNEGYHNSSKYMKVLKVWKEKADAIVLDDTEINEIEKLDLSEASTLDRARDIFLICLFTGLRFGDYNKLQPAHIDLKRRDIRLVTNKTKDPVVIPIDRRLEKILIKYTNLELPKMSNQKVNEYIKKVAELAGITQDVIKIYRTGNQTQEIAIPKNELISMHTARRTWNTKAEKSKRNTFAIMKATGHKNIDVHSGYIKYNLDEAIEEMRGLWD